MLFVLAELALTHCHEMIRKTLCQDRVALGDDLSHALSWMLINETIVFVHLCICRLEVKVRGDVARESKESKYCELR